MLWPLFPVLAPSVPEIEPRVMFNDALVTNVEKSCYREPFAGGIEENQESQL
jgi:hypothetical protein